MIREINDKNFTKFESKTKNIFTKLVLVSIFFILGLKIFLFEPINAYFLVIQRRFEANFLKTEF